MKFQITLWILILHTHSSISTEQHHCYQSKNTFSHGKYEYGQGRSLLKSATASRPRGSWACSIWGNFHFRTFDGKIYQFPGLCNYLLASHCGKPYEDFNIQIHQGLVNNIPAVFQLSIKLNYVFIEVVDHVPKIEGQRLQLPYNKNGIFIENSDDILRIRSTVMLEILWGQDNNIELIVNKKYIGETCGLCGNYNGDPRDDLEFDGTHIDPLLFGELNKIRRPGEICKDPIALSSKQCRIYKATCLNQLTDSKWKKCNTLVLPEPFVESYIMDMCLCKENEKFSTFCLCSTPAEYSHQCALAGGQPPEWRSPSLCYKRCRDNLIYKECSSPCTPACSNPGKETFCDGPCMAKCTCPEGYVLDDLTNSGCVRMENCSCIYNNKIYAPGSQFTTRRSSCVCSGGHWKCQDLPYPSVCSVEGGSHITTFDKTRYMFNGRCTYVLAKPCQNGSFLVTAEMKKCALSESATCLNRVFLLLYKALFEFEIKFDNNDFPYITYDENAMAKANVTVCWASSSYMIAYTRLGFYLEVQLKPIMQLYIIVDPAYKGKMCGLCGNFNFNQNDDFITSSGILESNAVDFANTWKIQYQCQNVIPDYIHPCMYAMEIEKYAQYWCQVLLDTEGPFAPCFTAVNAEEYYQDCLIDVCSSKRAEVNLCAVLSSYAWTCASNGIILSGWRKNVCERFTKECPETFVYSYNVTTSIPTCQSLAKPNSAKSITFFTVDGCVCPNKTYLNDQGLCVKREDCPCYYKEFVVHVNESLHVGRKICKCKNRILHCTSIQIPVCPPPKIYFDCDQAGEYARGAQCPESCDMTKPQCYSPLCVSGCICPKGLLLSHDGSCIKEEQCSCVYSGKHYTSGESVKIQCDNCVCKNRSWVCDSKPEKAICTLYGKGHYITFDNKDFTTNGNCQYTLVQDFCDNNNLKKGTFKIVTENIPCGTTGTSCSVAITVYLGAHKIILTRGLIDVVQRSGSDKMPFLTRKMGIYLVLETKIGLVLIWDQMTTIFVHLNIRYKKEVCGLCGNFDGKKENDFTTWDQCLVEDVSEFRDSWRISADCPEVYTSKQPCTINPYRMSSAQKMCHIIISDVFAKCHAEVNPLKFYEACVQDTCACDTGGDCNCFCTAIATYAQKCSEACVCIEWRSPTVCPLFCEGYSENDCQWHYKVCGSTCLKTCRNPSGICAANLRGLEGCYPKCPNERPYFNEDEMQCVATCGCLDNENYYYKLGEDVKSCNSCEKCICTEKGIQCHYVPKECRCKYEGLEMKTGEVIRLEEDSDECKIVKCEMNGIVTIPCYKDNNSSTDL